MKNIFSIMILLGLVHPNSTFAGLTRVCKGVQVDLSLAAPGEKDFAGGLTAKASGNGLWLVGKDGTEYTVRVGYDKPFAICVFSTDKEEVCLDKIKSETGIYEVPVKDKEGKTSAWLAFDLAKRSFSLTEAQEPKREFQFSSAASEGDQAHTSYHVMKIARRGGGSLRLELAQKYGAGGRQMEQWGGFKKRVSVDLSAPGKQFESRFGDEPCNSTIAEVETISRDGKTNKKTGGSIHE